MYLVHQCSNCGSNAGPSSEWRRPPPSSTGLCADRFGIGTHGQSIVMPIDHAIRHRPLAVAGFEPRARSVARRGRRRFRTKPAVLPLHHGAQTYAESRVRPTRRLTHGCHPPSPLSFRTCVRMFEGQNDVGTKPAEKRKDRRLRREDGMPLKRIAAQLGVSLSTVSLWVRDIELDPAHRERNRGRSTRSERPHGATSTAQGERRINNEGRDRARTGDPLHHAGCMLYWAEELRPETRSRSRTRDLTCLGSSANSYGSPWESRPTTSASRLNVYLTTGLGIDEIENYWLSILGLPRTCLRKHAINANFKSGSKRTGCPRAGLHHCMVGVVRGIAAEAAADHAHLRWICMSRRRSGASAGPPAPPAIARLVARCTRSPSRRDPEVGG